MSPQTIIKQEDFIASVADAFQYISYYHPVDYIKALHAPHNREQQNASG
jgi:fumarate hydratase class I